MSLYHQKIEGEVSEGRINGYICDGNGNKMKLGYVTNMGEDKCPKIKEFEEIRNLKLGGNQVWLATYPRSGTTCSQFFVSTMLEKFKNADEIIREDLMSKFLQF